MHSQMERLYLAARDLKAISGQSALARALGTSPQTLHNWEQRGISKAGMLNAQRSIGCSASWLETGQGNMAIGLESNVVNVPLGTRRVPLIGLQDAYTWTGSADPYAAVGVTEWLATDMELSGGAFAVEISGDSMLPKFLPGDRVIIDPNVSPQPGDFVVARSSTNEVVFLKYRPRGLGSSGSMVFELIPLNEDYPSMSSDTIEIRILGVMTEHRTYRRR